MWPDFAGLDGWEAPGFVTGASPVSFPLPGPRVSRWYEVAPIPSGGAVLPSSGFRLGGGQVVVRAAGERTQAQFTELRVFDVAFLDSFYLVATFTPCMLLLTAFDEDRVTPLWQASTDPLADAPYLMVPEGYAEQQLDVAAGAASIGTVTVGVVDAPIVPGDQDGGWMTEKLARLGLADIAGRRFRLERYVNESIPPVVLADGPATAVRMAESYAAFMLTIRDVRDTERRIRMTGGGGDLTLVPWGVRNGYGYDPALGSYLLNPSGGVAVTFVEGGIDPMLFLPYDPDNPLGPRRVGSVDLSAVALTHKHVPIEAWRASGGINTISGTGLGDPGSNPPESIPGAHDIYWRPQGSLGAWTRVEQPYIWGGVVLCGGLLGPCPYELYPDEDEPTAVQVNFFTFSGTESSMPDDMDDIELQIVCGRGGISEALPFYLEGEEAGEVARRIYDGEFSPRDARNEPIPTGIRYDAAALAQITDPVRIRLTEPVDDARAWLEEFIYAPLGWVPALDLQGQVSPVSQVPPESFAGLEMIGDATVEPSPDWNSGDRVINVVRFVYPRDYKPGVGPVFGPYPLEERTVVVEFRDEPSITRHGEQVHEIRGDAFRAVGRVSGEPLAAGQTAEQGYQLAVLRGTYLQDRYALGAPTMRVTALRSETATVRAGSWVGLDLSWFPDYITQRRGLLGLGQVVGISDLDCAWRTLTIEQTSFYSEPGS